MRSIRLTTARVQPKNKRDCYDYYTNSKRGGWKKELSPSLQEVFNELKVLTKEEVLKIARNIMKKYEK